MGTNASKNDDSTIAARKEGMLVHDLMAEVSYAKDVSAVVTNALHSGNINKQEYDHYLQMIKNIVDHPQLSRFYQEDIEVYNEKDILIPQKFIVRPDRIVKNKDGWVIIDYKTGKERPNHFAQISYYAELLEEMTQEKIKMLFSLHWEKHNSKNDRMMFYLRLKNKDENLFR